ncbi:MAG TPA: YfiR family protein, partial [Burkholderiaceae bacterium]
MSVRAMLLAVVLLAHGGAARAQTSAFDTSVKIAFVYNLAKFTEWPAGASPTRQAVLCVAGEAEPYAAGLAAVEGRLLGGREIRVRRLGRAPDMAGCQILYISRSEDKRIGELLAQAHAL